MKPRSTKQSQSALSICFYRRQKHCAGQWGSSHVGLMMQTKTSARCPKLIDRNPARMLIHTHLSHPHSMSDHRATVSVLNGHAVALRCLQTLVLRRKHPHRRMVSLQLIWTMTVTVSQLHMGPRN